MSDSEALLLIVSLNCAIAVSSVVPSEAALFMAVLRPMTICVESMPAISAAPMKEAASSALRPISRKEAAFVLISCARDPTSMPVCWPTVFRASSIVPASLASMPKAARTLLTLSTEVETSWLLSAANLMNWPESVSRSWPVTPKRVFTSPIAAPAVEKSVGIVAVILFRISPMLSRASPEAPVFWTIVSSPASTSFQATTDAAPTAASGSVTLFVRELPALLIVEPRDEAMLVPAASPAAVPATSPAPVISFVMVC